MKLILASGSPRRREILTDLGYSFDVKTADFDESQVSLEKPPEGVQALALGKATAAAEATSVDAPTVFLGSDTVVALNDAVMGKPTDEEDARAMLRSLSGRTHVVYTGVALVEKNERDEIVSNETFVEATEVTFFDLTEEEIDWYVRTGEPMDKAGAYAIQGIAGKFVSRFDGSYENVVGFPVDVVRDMLSRFGF